MACVPGEPAPGPGDYDPYVVQNLSAISLPTPIPSAEVWVKVIFYFLSFLIDIVGNSVVILIIVLNKRMTSTTNVLILNLAVSDLMVGCFCMWVHLGNSITVEWPFGEYVCKVNTFMQVMAVTSSILTLSAISVERFFAIVFPLRRLKTPITTVVVVCTNWFVAIAMASPQLFVRRTFEYYWANRHEVWCTEIWPKVYTDDECGTEMPGLVIYYTIVCVALYFIPIVIMACAYTMIVIKMVIRNRPGNLSTTSRLIQDRSRRKVIKMLLAVLCSFIVCWTPQQTLILWDIYRSREEEVDKRYILKIKYAAMYIAYSNSALNPILYGGFNENFRKGFKDAFNCFLCKRRTTVAPLNAGTSQQPRFNHTSAHCSTPVVTSTV